MSNLVLVDKGALQMLCSALERISKQQDRPILQEMVDAVKQTCVEVEKELPTDANRGQHLKYDVLNNPYMDEVDIPNKSVTPPPVAVTENGITRSISVKSSCSDNEVTNSSLTAVKETELKLCRSELLKYNNESIIFQPTITLLLTRINGEIYTVELFDKHHPDKETIMLTIPDSEKAFMKTIKLQLKYQLNLVTK